MPTPFTLTSRTCFRSLKPFHAPCNPTTIHLRRTNATLTTSLHSHLLKRSIPITYDYLNPTPSHLLNISLADIFTLNLTSNPPPTPTPTTSRPSLPLPNLTTPSPLPPTHHLIYFPPAIPAACLLPDGTDPLQSPGPPFSRRMWAGGSLRVNLRRPMLLNGARAACVERIVDVAVKGKEGEEKVFVGIERRVGVVGEGEGESGVLVRLGVDEGGGKEGRGEEGGEGGEWSVIERRNLVFMREAEASPSPPPSPSPAQTTSTTPNHHQQQQQEPEQKQPTTAPTAKILNPPTQTPDFSHTFTPTARLLFRYSALTWNAHAIHLDPSYVRDVEGHRGLLVHGPLSFTLLVTNLRRYLAAISNKELNNNSNNSSKDIGQGGEGREEVEYVEYRNLAPLYTDEIMKLCGRRKEEGKWEVWVEGPDGGVKVRGVVRTRLINDGDGASAEGREHGDLAMMGLSV